MTRNIILAPGEYYHIYNRGTDKRVIFSNNRDYERFLSLLYLANSNISIHLQLQGSTLNDVYKIDREKTLVDICAYCLMPNHFHLLVKEVDEGGISHFMQKLTTGYTMYFNKRYDRTGALFQGKFKAEHVGEDDNYLKYLIAYIHLNPIKLVDKNWKENGIKNKKLAEKFLNNYKFSSYLDYIHNREGMIINREALPDYFPSSIDFYKWVNYWLDFKVEP